MPLNLNAFAYLRRLYADSHFDICVQTGTQVGKTEWQSCDCMAVISLGLNCMQVQPKDEMRGKFIKMRVQGPMKASEYYANSAALSGPLLTWAGGGVLCFAFSNVQNEMIAFPADSVMVDEVDFCNIDNLSLLPDRLMGSLYGGFERRTSTPTVVGHEGCHNINYYYQNSDQKVWMVPCDKCGLVQELEWALNVVQEQRDSSGALCGYSLRDDSWKRGSTRDVRIFCRACGSPVNRLDTRGEWFAKNPDLAALRSGYLLSKLPSPLITVAKMVEDYNSAQGNPSKLQRFYNSWLGVPYQGVGDKITEHLLGQCVGEYLCENVRSADHSATMGIDVGDGYLAIRISDYPGGNRRRLRYVGFDTWSDLPGLVQKYNVKLVVIDNEPERTKVRELQAGVNKLPCRVVACQTKELRNSVDGISPDLRDVRSKSEIEMFTIDKTIWCDRVQQEYVRREVLLPLNWRWLDNQHWTHQMLNPVRVMEVNPNNGEVKFVWTGGNDHYFMADVYDHLASKIGAFFGLADISPEAAEFHSVFSQLDHVPLVARDEVFEMA